MYCQFNLTGKTILVTGASSGIGKATAIYINRLGAKVVMIARNEEKLKDIVKQTKDSNISYYLSDLKKIETIEKLVDNIVSREGKLNGFVHCAGIQEMRPLQVLKYNNIHDIMLLNFYAFVELSRCISKKTNYNLGASFVAVSSVASLHGEKSEVAYCASKSALDGSIRALAKELAVKKIRVNSVLPGFINTEMLTEYISFVGRDEFEKNIIRTQYLGLGETQDIANIIAFLLSDASRFITGTGLIADGGYLT